MELADILILIQAFVPFVLTAVKIVIVRLSVPVASLDIQWKVLSVLKLLFGLAWQVSLATALSAS